MDPICHWCEYRILPDQDSFTEFDGKAFHIGRIACYEEVTRFPQAAQEVYRIREEKRTLAALTTDEGDYQPFYVALRGSSEGAVIVSDTSRLDPGVPTTACWDCGKDVKMDETWSPKRKADLPWEQRPVYCAACFGRLEKAGMAKEVA